MNGISIFKITFGEEIYNAILVNSLLKIKYFVQGKCCTFSRQCALGADCLSLILILKKSD